MTAGQITRGRVHVAGPLEPRRVYDPEVAAEAVLEALDREAAGEDYADLTHELRCLRCDRLLPGQLWKLGEQLVELIDEQDATCGWESFERTELGPGETFCRPVG